MQFLRGLNDSYSNVKSHVLLLDPLPPISKIFSYVVQQERQIMANNAFVNLETKNLVAASSTTTCTFCEKP